MKQAFTLVELMIIVGIIALLAVIILAGWAISSQNKAAVNGYKTSMQGARAAMEMCAGAGAEIQPGRSGNQICALFGESVYPAFSPKCNSETPYFSINGSGDNWEVTTTVNSGGDAWDCRGCRLICDVNGCSAAQGTSCN